jgi:tRNA A-37 threonylcarbamoyl transferase component Bud32
VAEALEARARRHRRRRERRPARPGPHFAFFALPGGGGVRRQPEAPAAWEALAAQWLEANPPGARALKADGRVVAADLPGLAGTAVLKRYGAVAPGRLPRPVAAFRRAVAFAERGLDVPRPLLAAAGPGGAGVLVSEHVAAPDLLALATGPAFATWTPARRRACLEALGRSLRRLHDADVKHRDLKPSNLLVVEMPDGAFRFPVVDLEGARPGFSSVSWPRRARDLARLAASLPLSRAERLRVLVAYHRVLPRAPWDLRALASRVHARAEAHRRRLRTRYGAAAAPVQAPGGSPGRRG